MIHTIHVIDIENKVDFAEDVRIKRLNRASP
jgi:hypothetical protein